jgi:hypothetical protein
MIDPESPVRRAVLTVVLLAAAWGLGAASARADKLDVGLLEKANDVLDKLYTAKVKNVGVLPFRVKKGDDKPSFSAAPLCTGITGRLENALIMSNSLVKDETIGILANVSSLASKNRIGAWFSNEAERKKLFDLSYPLAWGNLKAQPDALLTGEIVNDGDCTKTKVKIEAIYRKDPSKLVPLAKFEVDTDRSLMGDLGYNFSLVGRGTRDRRDRMVASLVRRRGPKEPLPEGVEVATPANVGGMSVSIQYNGKDQEIKPVSADAANPEYYIRPMEPGTRFTLTLTYNGKRTDALGVVVKVNGRNTLYGEQGDSITLSRRIYRPERDKNKPERYTGFTYEGEGKEEGKVVPFKVLDAAESASREAQLGERVGWIDIDVFASGEEKEGDEVKLISSRATSDKRPRDAAEAQARLLKANRVTMEEPARRRNLSEKKEPRGASGLIVPDEKAHARVDLTFGKLPNPVQVGSLRIKYYDPKE